MSLKRSHRPPATGTELPGQGSLTSGDLRTQLVFSSNVDVENVEGGGLYRRTDIMTGGWRGRDGASLGQPPS